MNPVIATPRPMKMVEHGIILAQIMHPYLAALSDPLWV